MEFITEAQARAIYNEEIRKREEEWRLEAKRAQEEFDAKMKAAYEYIMNDRKDILYQIQNTIIKRASERRRATHLSHDLPEEVWNFIKKDEFNIAAIEKFLTDHGFGVKLEYLDNRNISCVCVFLKDKE